MKYNRKKIIKGAFEVFIKKGYDCTSVSDLQQELKMSRGAMYRYFKSKNELFTAVIDEYFFRIFGFIQVEIKKDLSVSGLIEKTCRYQKLVLSILSKNDVDYSILINYTALIIQAAKHYPGFVSRFVNIDNQFVLQWKSALKTDIDINVVRNDIDTDLLSILFNDVCMRKIYAVDEDDSLFIHNAAADIRWRKDILDYLCFLIKS